VLDAGLPASWPDAVVNATDRFTQGHLIERPPLFYGANLDHPVWVLSSASVDTTPIDERPDALVDLAQDQRPSYGLITTQTCDLAEDDRAPRQPWFAVAPVFRFEQSDRALQRDYVTALDPPAIAGRVWAADLRIEIPLEKSLLVGRDPIEAFPDEGGYVDLANLLARRRGRPALASVFHEVLGGTTAQLKEEGGGRRGQARAVRQQIYRLKLAIQDGTRLGPRAARIYVVLRGDLTPEVEEWFGTWWDRARAVAEAHGLQLLPVAYLDARQIDLELYDSLIEIRSPV
jgi:hypothetical protein